MDCPRSVLSVKSNAFTPIAAEKEKKMTNRNSALDDLRYGFRKNTNLIEEVGKCFLLSSFPLKAVCIAPQLTPLFQHMEANPDLTLDEIARFQPNVPKKKLKAFMYQLVKRGFLYERGLRNPIWFPRVSIIIPVRNRPRDIENCLYSLFELSYPLEKLETIVVDDASCDGTPDVISGFPVIYLRTKEQKGASFCRNSGAKQASGEILCFIDSDCVADSGWLRDLISVFEDTRVGACGGLVDSREDNSWLDRYEQVKSSLRIGNTCRDSRSGDPFFYVPSCNMAVRRKLFLEMGGFRPEMKVGEDVDLCWRILDLGYVIEYRPAAKVFHRHRNRILPFCCRRFDYGTSEPLLQSLHETRQKQFLVRPGVLGFWFPITMACLTGLSSLLIIGFLWLIGDTFIRWERAKKTGIVINPLLVLKAVLRSDMSFLYHLCFFFSRYYLLMLSIVSPFSPIMGAVIWSAHIGVGIVQFLITKPQLSVLAFIFYFSLEQISYQAGVWFGCFKTRFFAPISPKIRFFVAH